MKMFADSEADVLKKKKIMLIDMKKWNFFMLIDTILNLKVY